MTVPNLILDGKGEYLDIIYSAIVHALMFVQGQELTTTGTQTVNEKVNNLLLNNATDAINAVIADSKNHIGMFTVKAGLEPAGGKDHTLTLTVGTFDGTNNRATFADINDALTVIFDIAGNGTILNNTGSVALSHV